MAGQNVKKYKTDEKWFRERLRDVQLSQNGLARKLGLDHSVVSRVVQGKQALKPEWAGPMANELQVSLEELHRRAGFNAPSIPDDPVPLVGVVDDSGQVQERIAGRVERALKHLPDNAVALRVDCPGAPTDRWVLFYSPVQHIDREAIDTWAVVDVHGLGRFLSILRRSHEPGLFNLDNTCTGRGRKILNVEVTAASPVLAHYRPAA